MNKLLMNTVHLENHYNCICDLLPGWIVTCRGDFETFKKEVQESIAFYTDCAKENGDSYPKFLDEDFEIVYSFKM